MRVLIADADWRFAQQASDYLEARAHLVVHETRLTAAVEHTKHWQPDLVIVSAGLAEKGLLDTVYQMNPRPAVLITGQMDRSDVAWRAWQKGGDELLMKPLFRAEELQLAVRTALENAAAGTRRPRAAAASA
jgi:DNA-binding response OmpR family regulator